MKLTIYVSGNENLVTASGYMQGESFSQRAEARVERIANGKVRIDVDSKTFLYDENITEPDHFVEEDYSSCNLKTLAISGLLKMMTDDYCLPSVIEVKYTKKADKKVVNHTTKSPLTGLGTDAF